MSIDSCYEGVITKLTSQGKIQAISKKLLSLNTNDERVLYVYDILESLNAFPSVLKVTKTENVSMHYRNLGNQCFQSKADYKAWQYYNLSLMHAPIGSESYCLALANRSAVFFSLRNFKDCIEDIKVVFSLNYPAKLKDKLLKRQASCEESLNVDQSAVEVDHPGIIEILTLSGPIDARYPCASSKLEVVFSEQMGRHVIAKEDIKVGEVLVQENPYFALLLKSQYLFSCSFCLSRNLNLLPCHSCCFALYCSDKCKENAWKEYHSVECALMPIIMHMNFTKLELLALRTIIKARSDHDNWNSLFTTIQEAETQMNTEFRGHVKVNDKWIYDSKYYASIHTLASNIEKRNISDIFQKSVTAAVFLYLLKKATDFLVPENDEEKDKIEKCVAGTLLLHIMTSPTNMHGLSTNIETAAGNYVDEISIASAPYAFHSLLNHSCAPNVVRFGKLGTGQMTLYALRPIKKGIQLLDNYGSHHAIQDRKTRQESLKFQYKFTCLCEACVDEWPTYFTMKPSKNLPIDILTLKEEILNSFALEMLQKGDKCVAFGIYKELCSLAEVLEPYAPCVEQADVQEALKQCLIIFRGLLPYGFSNVVEWTAILPKV